MVFVVLVAVIATLSAGLYLLLERRYSTWRRKGVPGPPASALPLRVPKVVRMKESFSDVADRIYREYRDAPVAGSYIFSRPVLHIHDPEIIKQVFIKEFQDFSGRGFASHGNYDPMTTGLFFESGARWRKLRLKLSPAFTSGKIKHMFHTIKKNSDQLVDYLGEEVLAHGGSHTEDVRLLMMRLFVDTVSSVTFGVESNTVRHADSAFLRHTQLAVAPSLGNALRMMLSFFGHSLKRLLRVGTSNPEAWSFFADLVRRTVGYREQNGVSRADLLNMLIELKNKGFVAADGANGQSAGAGEGGNHEKMTLDEITAQVIIFLLAGFESSSITTSFTLYEIAKAPEILEKVMREVDQVMEKFSGEVSYEAIMSMPYLEKAISETFRKYPTLGFLTREATVTRKVPLTDVTVDKGTLLLIPVRALHNDPQYWPDPEKYDPDRFDDDVRGSRPDHAYVPFGGGPRMCIAARLGMVQIKTSLLTLLSAFSVIPSESNKPGKVSLNPRSFATTPDGSLHVCFRLRDTPAADAVRARIASRS